MQIQTARQQVPEHQQSQVLGAWEQHDAFQHVGRHLAPSRNSSTAGGTDGKCKLCKNSSLFKFGSWKLIFKSAAAARTNALGIFPMT
jgi:hypothetical protein